MWHGSVSILGRRQVDQGSADPLARQFFIFWLYKCTKIGSLTPLEIGKYPLTHPGKNPGDVLSEHTSFSGPTSLDRRWRFWDRRWRFWEWWWKNWAVRLQTTQNAEKSYSYSGWKQASFYRLELLVRIPVWRIVRIPVWRIVRLVEYQWDVFTCIVFTSV